MEVLNVGEMWRYQMWGKCGGVSPGTSGISECSVSWTLITVHIPLFTVSDYGCCIISF